MLLIVWAVASSWLTVTGSPCATPGPVLRAIREDEDTAGVARQERARLH